MALSSRKRMTSILAAAVLLVQTVVSLPGACVCASEQGPVVQSCCQQEAAPSQASDPDDQAATSCCDNGPCGCESPANDCLGECQCGDNDTGSPVAPADTPKQKPRSVDFGFHAPQLAVHSAVLTSQHGASRFPPRDTIAAHSVQALLCIWRI